MFRPLAFLFVFSSIFWSHAQLHASTQECDLSIQKQNYVALLYRKAFQDQKADLRFSWLDPANFQNPDSSCLETEHTFIRPWQIEDLHAWNKHELHHDTTPLFASMFGAPTFDPKKDFYQTRNKLILLKLAQKHFGLNPKDCCMNHNLFIIEQKSSRKRMGYFQFQEEYNEGLVEFDWRIKPNFRGQGLGSEILTRMKKCVDKHLGMSLTEILFADEDESFTTELKNPHPDFSTLMAYLRPRTLVFSGVVGGISILNSASLHVSLKNGFTPYEGSIDELIALWDYRLIDIGVYLVYPARARSEDSKNHLDSHFLEQIFPNLINRNPQIQQQAVQETMDHYGMTNANLLHPSRESMQNIVQIIEHDFILKQAMNNPQLEETFKENIDNISDPTEQLKAINRWIETTLCLYDSDRAYALGSTL